MMGSKKDNKLDGVILRLLGMDYGSACGNLIDSQGNKIGEVKIYSRGVPKGNILSSNCEWEKTDLMDDCSILGNYRITRDAYELDECLKNLNQDASQPSKDSTTGTSDLNERKAVHMTNSKSKVVADMKFIGWTPIGTWSGAVRTWHCRIADKRYGLTFVYNEWHYRVLNKEMTSSTPQILVDLPEPHDVLDPKPAASAAMQQRRAAITQEAEDIATWLAVSRTV